MNKEYTFYIKKSLFFFSFLLTVLAVMLFVVFIFMDYTYITNKENTLKLMEVWRIISVIFLGFSLLGGYRIFKKLIQKEPEIIIDKTGLYFDPKVGKIIWDDIDEIKIKYIGSDIITFSDNCLFYVYLKNPRQYIKDGKILRKIENRKRRNSYGDLQFTNICFRKQTEEIKNVIEYYLKVDRLN